MWSIGSISFVLGCEHRWPQNTSQTNVQKKLIFQTLSLISRKIMWFAFNLILDWRTMAVTVDLARDLKVTHCQFSAMTFVFTQYSFCNSFIQGLLTQLLTKVTILESTKFWTGCYLERIFLSNPLVQFCSGCDCII